MSALLHKILNQGVLTLQKILEICSLLEIHLNNIRLFVVNVNGAQHFVY